jgi:protein SCO1
MPFRSISQHCRLQPPFPVLIAIAAMFAFSGCRNPAPPPAHTYELKGQILAVDQTRQELTVKHGDIAGFMPAMTMPYQVRDANLLKGRTAGELITATLVVDGSIGYLQSITHDGTAPLADEKPPVKAMNLLSVGEQVREAELVDQAGRQHSFADWRGQVIAVTFVYTRCPLPNYCPLIDRQFAAVQAEVAASAELRGHVRLVSVTLDPEYDTPAVLLRHARTLKADPAVWTWLTGSRDHVEAFASQFGVSVMREPSQPSELVHNMRTAIIDGNGRLVALLNGADWKPAKLIAEMRNARGRG